MLLLKVLKFVNVVMQFYEEHEEKSEKVEEQSVVTADPSASKMLYFQLLHLNPIKVSFALLFAQK